MTAGYGINALRYRLALGTTVRGRMRFWLLVLLSLVLIMGAMVESEDSLVEKAMVMERDVRSDTEKCSLTKRHQPWYHEVNETTDICEGRNERPVSDMLMERVRKKSKASGNRRESGGNLVILERRRQLTAKVRQPETTAGDTEHRQRRITFRIPVFPGQGQFLTVLSIGTPAIRFSALIDTGSDLVWRQCRPCRRCYLESAGFGFPIFNPSRSSTFRKATCRSPLCNPDELYGISCNEDGHTCSYQTYYEDPQAFTRGDLAVDTLSIPVSPSSSCVQAIRNFTFGCSYESMGPYNFAGAGGILGLGEGNLSLPSQLGITRFSYCLRRIDAWNIFNSPSPNRTSLPVPPSPRPPPSSAASLLVLGDNAHLSKDKEVQSTRIVSPGYIVELEGISVGGHQLNVSRSVFRDGGTLIDTGTTFSTLPTEAFRSLCAAFRARIPLKPWKGHSPRNLSLCYQSMPSPIPSLTFHFNGADLHLPPENYFIFIDNIYCLAVLESQDMNFIYGNIQQQDFHILFDLKARLISFQPTTCSSLHDG
ncbi:hypothetical protein KP509_18G014400 [Ceratopteris richardii]|uniref:Peptidase A1 domain-containing protein n=1 Tax=Ceratopteris richardii TaxID=49495 RepID=A0A8T2SMV8_CERRI|nr:hypothetical protein KP509_18G014400 [Ceratopteris richardii]